MADCSSPETERQVLGACLLDASVIPLVAGVMQPADWTVPGYAAAWGEVLALVDRREPVDSITLAHGLQRSNPAAYAVLGGWTGVLALTDIVPTVVHVEAYARHLADLGRVRRIGAAALAVTRAASDPSVTPDALDALVHDALRAAQSTTAAGRPLSYREVLRDGVAAAWARAEGEDHVAPTGLRSLDAILGGGLRAGQLGVLAARPAMGKSALAWQVAESAARVGRVPFVSLEMSGVELGQRALAARTSVPLGRMRGGSLGAPELDALGIAAHDAPNLPIEVHDVVDDRTTVARIRAIVAAARTRGDLALVVVDYLQLVCPTSHRREGTREQEVAEISRGLKLLARAAKVPVLVLAQLNREVEKRAADDRRPRLSDLRESGSLEQDADVVLFVYRDEVARPGEGERGTAEVIVAKQRNGELGTARLRWVGERTRFEEPEAAGGYAPAPHAANDDMEPV